MDQIATDRLYITNLYRLIFVRYIYLLNTLSFLAENLPEENPLLDENPPGKKPPIEPTGLFEKGLMGELVISARGTLETGYDAGGALLNGAMDLGVAVLGAGLGGAIPGGDIVGKIGVTAIMGGVQMLRGGIGTNYDGTLNAKYDKNLFQSGKFMSIAVTTGFSMIGQAAGYGVGKGLGSLNLTDSKSIGSIAMLSSLTSGLISGVGSSMQFGGDGFQLTGFNTTGFATGAATTMINSIIGGAMAQATARRREDDEAILADIAKETGNDPQVMADAKRALGIPLSKDEQTLYPPREHHEMTLQELRSAGPAANNVYDMLKTKYETLTGGKYDQDGGAVGNATMVLLAQKNNMSVNEFIAAYSSDPSSVNLDVSPQEIATRADAQINATLNNLDWSALDSFQFSDKLPPMSLDAAMKLSNSGSSSGAGYNPNPFGGGGSFTFEQMVAMQNGTTTYSQMMNPGTRLINDTPGFGYALAGMAGMMIAPYAAPLYGPALLGAYEAATTTAGIAAYEALTTAGMATASLFNTLSPAMGMQLFSAGIGAGFGALTTYSSKGDTAMPQDYMNNMVTNAATWYLTGPGGAGNSVLGAAGYGAAVNGFGNVFSQAYEMTYNSSKSWDWLSFGASTVGGAAGGAGGYYPANADWGSVSNTAVRNSLSWFTQFGAQMGSGGWIGTQPWSWGR
jgi:hypothetical protein